jgi:hypothetical protein
MTSVHGTNAKCPRHPAMSEFEGKPENICSVRVFRILTLNGHAARVIETWPSRSTSLQLFRHPRLAQGIFPSRQHLGLSVRQAVLDALNPKIRVTCAY